MAAANIVAPPPPPTANSEILDGEISRRRRGSRRRHKAPIACSSGGTTTDGSVCFSDSGGSEEEDDRTGSWRSGGSQEMDLESGELEMEVHYYAAMRRRRRRRRKREKKKEKEEERECRICHLNLVGHAENLEMGPGMELGCDCKADLGAAHSHCADTWFKIRGNLTCEICGAVALNVAGEQTTEGNHNDGLAAESTVATEVHSETLSLCNSRRIMNFLFGCMIVAFIVSWLFHFHKLR